MITRRFLISLLFLPLFYFSHCSKTPTETKGLSLSGSVKLEGQTDHSGVTVALYAPAELDTMVLRMNREFHTVGIPISQATEFDRRLAEPIYQTQTKADGSYKLEGISEGVYNLVAVKPGYGWQYLYEIEIAKGTKTTNAENIVLYPEMEVSGTISQYTVWPSEHHIIIKGDVTVPEGEALIIDKGEVIWFDGFYGPRKEVNLSKWRARPNDHRLRDGLEIAIVPDQETPAEVIWMEIPSATFGIGQSSLMEVAAASET